MVIVIAAYVLFMFFYIENINKNVLKHFGDECKSFVFKNRFYWRGIRALIFFEKLKKKGFDEIDEKSILTMIDKELRLKRFNVLKSPFCGFVSLGFALFDNLFSKLEFDYLLLLTLIYAVIFLLVISVGGSLKTEDYTMKDLQMFVMWYDKFSVSLNKSRNQ